jgi:hypothetical protein
LKQEGGEGFDPSEFASKPAAVAEAPKAKAKVNVEVESESDDGDEMADKDFLEELRRLG